MGNDSTRTDTEGEPTPTYCIACGSELPDKASFCPDCGAEVDARSDSGNGGSKTGRAHPDPEKVASKAEGDIPPKLLSETREPNILLSGIRNEGSVMLFDDPLISHIETDEQPEHLLKHPSCGLRIIDPSGDERTPHHGTDGYRFLLITDRRVLYVAAHEGEDIVREFDYDNIENVKTKGALLSSPKIEFQTTDGTKYVFAHNRTNAAKMRLPNAGEYIENKIE